MECQARLDRKVRLERWGQLVLRGYRVNKAQRGYLELRESKGSGENPEKRVCKALKGTRALRDLLERKDHKVFPESKARRESKEKQAQRAKTEAQVGKPSIYRRMSKN